ncbi:portal protein [Photobacterium halotolerans]|uniref:portal protein n=1 Tax=Photobacterium halotolerans TaxID=265726 RepID=UPI0004138C6C|nr:hypothetical protein [Photobacterium halotolerans]
MQGLQQAALQAQADTAMKEMEGEYRPLPVMDRLAAHVKECWQQAQHDRGSLNNRMLDCLRRRKGEYSTDKLQNIRAMGGSEIYMRLTATKCISARSWLSDIFTPAGDKPWAISPTPMPDLPPHFKQKLIMTAVQGAVQLGVPLEQMQELLEKHEDRIRDEVAQESEKRAERMSQKIYDVLVEGGFRQEFDAWLDDLVTYPVAIFKGPIYRRRKRLKWVDVANGDYQPSTAFEVIREFKRVSPFDFFPSPSAVNINDDWVIERHRLTATDLSAMRGAAGYHGKGITLALNEYRLGGLREWMSVDGERSRLEGRDATANKSTTIDALEWSGKLQGKILLEWGMDARSIPDPYEEYLVSIMTVGNYVIRALVNPDPTDRMDYFKCSWRSVPNSFWGEALPEILKDCQDMCNAAARALANNMGYSSGPMVAVSQDRLAKGQDATKLHPWKVFGVTESRTGSSAAPINFFQPNSNAQELLGIYERFSRYADDITGLPAYAFGSDQAAGAGRTASGLSMLMSAASKTIKNLVRSIDIQVIEPCITKVFNHLMLDPTVDKTCKGDLQIKAIGSEALLHKEAKNQMQQQFLAMTNNPVDLQIVGLEGRRELLREAAKGLDIPVDRVIPSQEELELRQMEQAQQEMMMAEQEQAANAQ